MQKYTYFFIQPTLLSLKLLNIHHFVLRFTPFNVTLHQIYTFTNMTISNFIRCLTAAALLITLASCDGGKFRVEGSISDAKDSVLYLEHIGLNGPEVVDSAKLDADGDFAFSGNGVTAPDFYRLRIASSIINVSIDSTETVTFKASYPTMATRYEVEGSENCKKIKELALMQIQLLGRALAIDRDERLGARQAEDSIEAIVAQYKEVVRRDYIFKEPQKAYAYFALFQTLGRRLIFNPRESDEDIRCFAAVATSWDTFYPGSERGENLHNIAIEGLKTLRIQQQRAMGPAIDASQIEVTNLIDVPLTDNQGKRRSLRELVGKVVLLDFHAFSSQGSMQRIMLLRDLYNKYHERGLEIYQVSVDDNEHFWKTQTAALPWICVRDVDGSQSQYLTRYNVQQIPTFFLIDKTNALYKRDTQIKNLDDEIEGLL